MNPRTTFTALMGWCPGVKYAAKFVPDREVSNRRIAFSIALLTVIAVSTYYTSGALLAWVNIPNAAPLSRKLSEPTLGTREGRLYISFGQVTKGVSSTYTGPGYLQLSTYFAELQNGTLVEVTSINSVNWGSGISQSLLLTRDNTWKLVYSYYLLYNLSQYEHTPLYLIESAEGADWNNPTEPYNRSVEQVNPTLLELEDGSLFLLFRANKTWMYTIKSEGGWSTPTHAPFSIENVVGGEFLYESAFIDADGCVNVVWDEGSYEGNDLGLRYSTLINGAWSETRSLTSDLVILNGQQPRMFYSVFRGGYYLSVTSLLQTGSPEWHPVTMLYFSSDFAKWELLSYFDTWGYSIVELGDGSLARIVEGRGANSLYYSRSGDGRSWSSDVVVDMIVDESLISREASYQRFNYVYVISVIVTLASLLVLAKVSIVS